MYRRSLISLGEIIIGNADWGFWFDVTEGDDDATTEAPAGGAGGTGTSADRDSSDGGAPGRGETR